MNGQSRDMQGKWFLYILAALIVISCAFVFFTLGQRNPLEKALGSATEATSPKKVQK